MKWTMFFAACAAISVVLVITTAALAVPGLISYQGRLADGSGVPVTGDRPVMFSLYTTATGGGALWTEGRTVSATNGMFSVLLGAVTPVPAAIFDNDNVYLGVTVDTDPEMVPRQRLGSVSYSFKSASAASADTAAEAVHAVNADHAATAAYADSADNATNADYASEAGYATNAINATNATNATNAANADTVDSMHAAEIIDAASAEVRIPISSVPFTISASGSYYLTGDLMYTPIAGSAITVSKDNVTIDLMGYDLIGPGKASGGNKGIDMNGNINVEIRNGTIRDFGGYGIYEGEAGRNYRIVSVRALENGYVGIFLAGDSHAIRDCTASGNGGDGIFANEACSVTGCTASFNGGTGIMCMNGATITGNTAYHNTTDGIYAGIGCLISGNTVGDNTLIGIQCSYGCEVTANVAFYNDSTGIYADAGSTVRNNTVRNNNQSKYTAQAGIKAGGGCTVKGNTLAYNDINGISASTDCAVEENLVTGTSTGGNVGINFTTAGSFYANNRVSGFGSSNYVGSVPTGAGDGGGNASF